jgi:hypothetical protein
MTSELGFFVSLVLFAVASSFLFFRLFIKVILSGILAEAFMTSCTMVVCLIKEWYETKSGSV